MSNYDSDVLLSTEEYQKCQRIWQIYRILKTESEVIRSGFGTYGVYDYEVGVSFDMNRSESDLEYTAGMQILVMLITALFPDLFSEEDKQTMLYTTLIHEVGERKFGDIPDDGNRDEERKNRLELEAVTDILKGLPEDLAEKVRFDFMAMQMRSSKLGQFLYCADKVEAVLQGLIYEDEGRGGDLKIKKDWTSQDRRGSETTGSTALADVWAVHFLEVTSKMYAQKLFIGILRAAVEDVRGEWFAWINNV